MSFKIHNNIINDNITSYIVNKHHRVVSHIGTALYWDSSEAWVLFFGSKKVHLEYDSAGADYVLAAQLKKLSILCNTGYGYKNLINSGGNDSLCKVDNVLAMK